MDLAGPYREVHVPQRNNAWEALPYAFELEEGGLFRDGGGHGVL